MIKKIKLSIILIIIATTQSNALIEVDITRGNLDPLPIAVSPLSADKDTNEKLTKELKIDNGDTAIGSGFKFPLVISTSIKANTLRGSIKK